MGSAAMVSVPSSGSPFSTVLPSPKNLKLPPIHLPPLTAPSEQGSAGRHATQGRPDAERHVHHGENSGIQGSESPYQSTKSASLGPAPVAGAARVRAGQAGLVPAQPASTTGGNGIGPAAQQVSDALQGTQSVVSLGPRRSDGGDTASREPPRHRHSSPHLGEKGGLRQMEHRGEEAAGQAPNALAPLVPMPAGAVPWAQKAALPPLKLQGEDLLGARQSSTPLAMELCATTTQEGAEIPLPGRSDAAGAIGAGAAEAGAGKRPASYAIHAVTYNMHSKVLQSLPPELLPQRISAVGSEQEGAEEMREVDIYIIGTQENRDTCAWVKLLQAVLPAEYDLLAQHNMWQIHLAVFVHSRLRDLCSVVSCACVPTGFANTLGNKGGVGVSFRLGSQSFLAISSHFQAHGHRTKARNADYQRIRSALFRPQPGCRLADGCTPAGLSLRPSASLPALACLGCNPHAATSPVERAASAAVALPACSCPHAHPPSPAASPRKPLLPAAAGGSTGGGPAIPHRQEPAEGLAAEPGSHPDLIPAGHGSGPAARSLPAAAAAAASRNPKQVLREEAAQPLLLCNQEGQEAAPAGRDVTGEHDVTIWLGDLNYRIDASREEVEELLQGTEVRRALVDKDQLLQEMRAHRVFCGFQEGPLAFRPSYKFDPGTDTYDSTAKQRVPSWTDRILWRLASPGMGCPSAPAYAVHLAYYSSVMAMAASDHKPVVAGLVVERRLPAPSAADGRTAARPAAFRRQPGGPAAGASEVFLPAAVRAAAHAPPDACAAKARTAGGDHTAASACSLRGVLCSLLSSWRGSRRVHPEMRPLASPTEPPGMGAAGSL